SMPAYCLSILPQQPRSALFPYTTLFRSVAPVLGAIGSKNVDEETNLAFTASATDHDIPANTLTFSLANGTTSCLSVTSCIVPVGASINSSSGAFSWTPTEAQGPGTYRCSGNVTDDGSPALSDSDESSVTVAEV